MRREKRETPRRKLSRKKVLCVIVICILAFCLLSMAGSAAAFRLLFPRQSGVPKLHFSYEEMNAPIPRTGFTFPSGKNQLRGWCYDAAQPQGRIVVVNGIGAGADEHLQEILYFVEHGWSVLTWDATGVGRSEGRGIVGLQQIREDLEAFLAWYPDSGLSDGLPLFLYSHSAGAWAAAHCLDDCGERRAAVCICGFDRPGEIMYYHARQRAGFLAGTQYPFLLLENRFLFGADANDSAREAVNASGVPVLLINCSSDDLVPRQYGLAADPSYYDNPKVRCREITSQFQNEHATPWLSPAAAEYVYYFEAQDAVDKARASELDLDFMQSILDFYLEAA